MFTLLGNRKRYIAWKSGDMYRVDDLAIIKDIDLGKVVLGLDEFRVVKSNLYDYMSTIKRNAQIISIKDAAYIIARCGIRAGSIVVEGGVGSGSLTTALLYYTRPGGKVITYEIRKDFKEFALRNVERIDHKHWLIKNGDVRKDVSERNIDAFVLDIPDPWNAVEIGYRALKLGGCFFAYVPTCNQVEKVYKELEQHGFEDLEASELIQRKIHVGAMGTRPDNIEVGHTGFLVFGRKV